MSRLIIYKAPWSELSKAGVSTTFPDGGSSDILSQKIDYSDSAPPQIGDRTLEFLENGHLEASSTRLSPWRVAKVEEYAANTGVEEFSEVVVATCEYAPLPDASNPWHRSRLGSITVENFGGDEAAFEQWQRSQSVPA